MNSKGLVVRQFVNFQKEAVLDEAIRAALRQNRARAPLREVEMKRSPNCCRPVSLCVLLVGLIVSGCTQDVAVDEQEFRMAPPFELSDLAGNNVQLSDFEGKVVLLDIWATWCTPCLEGIPVYNELREKYQADGLEIVGIAVQSPFDTIQPVVDKYEIEYPILVGNTDIENAYRLIGFPTAYLIDREGAIRKTLLGTTQQAGAEDEIKQLLAFGS